MGKELAKLISGKTKPTLEQVIHNTIKSKSEYNLDSLLKASQNFARQLLAIKKGEPFKFDDVNKKFFLLLNAYYAPRPRNMRKVHPSSLRHECERKMFYLLKGVGYSDKIVDTIDGRIQMIFDSGHWFHGYIQAVLLDAGILVEAEVPVKIPEKYVDGRMDGLILWEGERIALEIKTMNSRRFKIGKIAPFEDNEFQNSFYADHLGIEKVAYLYYNKDTSEMKIHIKKVRKKFVEIAHEKIDYVLKRIDKGKAPKYKVCDSKRDKEALGCPFRSICFK